jgi:lipopolysaccharide export system permease protein
MRIVSLMLTRLILVRFFAILLGVAIFVLSLEVVSYSREILALRPDDFSIVPEYMLTRLPIMLSTFLPLSILLAILLTLTELSYRNELTALWSSGVSPVRIIVMLLPLAFFTGGLHFALSNYLIPQVTPKLHVWGVGDYGMSKLKIGEESTIWMRSGKDILRVSTASPDSKKLTGVMIFRRNADGLLTEQIYAAEAENSGGRWTLKNVDIYYSDAIPMTHVDTQVYSGSMTPAAAGERSGEPEEMSLTDLGYFIDNGGFGIKPVWVYETWWNKRLALFFSALVMIAMCVPLATKFRRGGGMGNLFAAGVGLGFLYFVTDGISITMGEMGFVRPWLAAWFPVLSFTAISTSIWLGTERV